MSPILFLGLLLKSSQSPCSFSFAFLVVNLRKLSCRKMEWKRSDAPAQKKMEWKKSDAPRGKWLNVIQFRDKLYQISGYQVFSLLFALLELLPIHFAGQPHDPRLCLHPSQPADGGPWAWACCRKVFV